MDIRVGKVTHYFDRLGVAVLDLYGELKLGDTVHIRGKTTDFTQQVLSMEVEHQKIQEVGSGTEAALKVAQPVREGDILYKVVAD